MRSTSKLPSVHLYPVNLTGRTTVMLGSLMLTVIFTRGGYICLSCFRCMISNCSSQNEISEAFICKHSYYNHNFITSTVIDKTVAFDGWNPIWH